MKNKIKDNIMLDIETMGNSSDSAIISIGAVYFDESGLGETFYEKINLESSIDTGLKIDPSTILWWLQQSNEARREFINNEKEKSLPETLFLFSKFIKMNPKSLIWGNGSDFDNVIILNAYKKLKINLPWNHWQNRCFRTLKSLYPKIKKPDNNNMAHHALADSIWQAKYAINILNFIK